MYGNGEKLKTLYFINDNSVRNATYNIIFRENTIDVFRHEWYYSEVEMTDNKKMRYVF